MNFYFDDKELEAKAVEKVKNVNSVLKKFIQKGTKENELDIHILNFLEQKIDYNRKEMKKNV